MTYAIGQPVRVTKSLSVQAKSGVALPAGASGTVVDVRDQVIPRPVPTLGRAGRGRDLRRGLRGQTTWRPTARRASTSRPMTIVASTRDEAVGQGHDVEIASTAMPV
jgi:hypothetical protein